MADYSPRQSSPDQPPGPDKVKHPEGPRNLEKWLFEGPVSPKINNRNQKSGSEGHSTLMRRKILCFTRFTVFHLFHPISAGKSITSGEAPLWEGETRWIGNRVKPEKSWWNILKRFTLYFSRMFHPVGFTLFFRVPLHPAKTRLPEISRLF